MMPLLVPRIMSDAQSACLDYDYTDLSELIATLYNPLWCMVISRNDGRTSRTPSDGPADD